ncbi:MAG: YqiA/YcfP family alpha/beta fold hydrolase, partial [Thiolinea sp.]
MFLYLHGFRSSPQSTKAQQFRQWLAERGREAEWVCPALPYDPQQAIEQLSAIINDSDVEPKLVG